MIAIDEDALFEQFRRGGDPAALGAVFDSVAPALLRVAQHLVRDTHDAEDLLHSTFVTAIETRLRWDRERGLFPWLVGILAMRARELLRQRMRMPDPSRLPTPATDDPAEAAVRRESESAILVAIEGVPEAYRAVVRLHLRHGLDPGEIASALGRPAGTVRTQLVRGLRALRATLPIGASLVVAESSEAASIAVVRGLLLGGAGAKGAAATAGIVAMKKTFLAAAAALFASIVGIGWWQHEASSPQAIGRAMEQARVASGTSASGPQVDPTAIPDRIPATPSPAATERQPVAGPLLAVPRGSLRVRTRYDAAHGGGPAPGMVIHVWPGGRWSMPERGQDRRGTTDLSGEVVFDGLEAGPLRVMLPVWEPGNMIPDTSGVQIVAGQQASFDGEIHVGRPVSGEVVDEDGHPIAGASVDFSCAGAMQASREVAHTDASGSFRANAVAFESLVGARARGYASSPSVALPRGDETVRIVMSTSSGSLRCRVTHQGQPVAGAQVTARSLGVVPFRETRTGPQPFVTPSTSTDERGMALVEGLPAELVKVSVHRGGLLDVSREVRIPDHGTVDLDIVIPATGSVSGRVTLPDGSPFVGAEVLAGSHLPVGALTSVQVADDGSFSIRSMPPGDHGLVAWRASADEIAITQVRVRESEDTHVDLVARKQPGVAGRVVDQDGNGVGGYTVVATEQSSWARSRTAVTDAGGSFEITSLTAYRIRVVAVPPRGSEEVPAGSLADVEPGSRDVLLRVRRGSGRVSATFLASNGVAYADEAVRLRIDGEIEGHWSRTGVDGHVAFDGIPSGRIHLEVVDGGLPRDIVDPFDLAPDEERDLGSRTLLAPGRVTLVLRDGDGRPWSGTPPVFTITDIDPRSQWSMQTELDTDGHRFAVVGEGRRRIHLDNEVYRDLAADDVAVDVQRGAAQSVTIVLREGVSGVLSFPREASTGIPIDASLDLRVEDGTGQVVRARTLFTTVGKGFSLHLCLSPGDYRVQAQSSVGVRHHGRFSVAAGVPFDVTVPIGS